MTTLLRSIPDAGAASLSQADMAELLGAFNDAAVRLSAAHESLSAEVERLKAELRQANEQLERSRRLTALGEMAAGIAHEVRNPLSSIRLHARMLEQDLGDRPAQRVVAEKIIAAVRGLDLVVTDVLAFAKETTVHPALVEASDMLGRAVAECTAWAVEAGGSGAAPEIVRRDLERAPIVAACDPHLVHRALVNVIRNAIEAMSGQGWAGRVLTVDAFCKTVPAAVGSARRMVVLSVRDRGPGIRPEVMARMFNPFFTTREAGTGLGLAIVHRIVDAHGGRVSVRNAGPEGCERAGAVGAERMGGAVVELLFPADPPTEGSFAQAGRHPADPQGHMVTEDAA